MRTRSVIASFLVLFQVSGQVSSFISLEQGMNWSVMEFEEDTIADVLHIGGEFGQPIGASFYCSGVVGWNGTAYAPMGCGVNAGAWDCVTPIGNGGVVFEMEIWNGELYAAGGFDHSGSVDSVNNIARWDGSTWQPLLGGVDGNVFGMKAYPDGLYVAGWFVHADTLTVNGLARWDGSQWHKVHDLPQLYSGDINRINDVAVYNGEVYIGGNFGGSSGRVDIAKWNGTDWVSLDGQGFLGTVSTVNKLKGHDGLLYVAGSFSDYPPLGVATNPGSGILAWDGVNWIDLAGGTDGSSNASVLDMVWIHDTLYAVGRFNMIGGVPTGRVARWDGTRWCSLVPPGYFYPDIVAIGTFRDSLYVGGSFTTAGPDSINRIAKWIGGSYTDTCGFGVGILEHNAPAFTLHPNPASSSLTLTVPAGTAATTVLLTDPLGRAVLRQPLRGTTTSLDVRVLAPGPYLAVLLDKHGQRVEVGRFVRE